MPVMVVEEDALAAVATRGQVIEPAGNLESVRPRHRLTVVVDTRRWAPRDAFGTLSTALCDRAGVRPLGGSNGHVRGRDCLGFSLRPS